MESALKKLLPGGKFVGVSRIRSNQMAAIRGHGNKTTERRMRLALVRAGISGWVINARQIPGKPDFLFADSRLVVFVDGCFWHGCLKCGHVPRKRSKFWAAKMVRNRQRDCNVDFSLTKLGYHVLRFWEHELAIDIRNCVERISRVQINQSRPSPPRRRGNHVGESAGSR